MYKDTPYDTIMWISDNDPTVVRWIPKDPQSDDYQIFLAWQAEGGVVAPYDALPEPTPVPEPAPGQGTNVLVVDDEFIAAIEGSQNIAQIRKAIVDAVHRGRGPGRIKTEG